METTISHPRLPSEILDDIVDFLHDDSEALHRCCLVLKPWISRTRKHLFADIKFQSDNDLDSWKKTFPDPMNSPARHTRTLTIECDPGDTGEGSWIQSFSSVERLVVNYTWAIIDITHLRAPVPFYTFAPSLKSLLITALLLPDSQILDFVRSLLVLEDLTLICDGVIDADASNRPTITSTSPPLTGSLELFVSDGLAWILRPLVELPGGLRFRKLELAWCCELDLSLVMELVTACSDTLECLDIGCEIYGTLGSVPMLPSRLLAPPYTDELEPGTIDLSKTTRLKDVVFRCPSESLDSRWIIMMLETITSNHQDLRQISIHVPFTPDSTRDLRPIEQVEVANPGMLWLDLDRLLVQIWELHSIHSTVVCLQSVNRTMLVDY